MRLTVELPGLKDLLVGEEGRIIIAVTGAMKEATLGLKDELRDQVRRAGLGNRLANTWRSEVYPKSGRSMAPAGYIYSKAPEIIDSYARGATISRVGGQSYLWIPTDYAPRSRGRGAKRATPDEVERIYDADLVIRRSKRGTLLASIPVVKARSGRGFRKATKGRTSKGRQAELVPMFVLLRATKKPKALDLVGAANRWASRVPKMFTDRWR